MSPNEAYEKALQAQYRHRRDIGLEEWERRQKECDYCERLSRSLSLMFADDLGGVVAHYNKDLDGSETAQLLRIVYLQVQARRQELTKLTYGEEYMHWMRVYAGVEDAA